jgi:hypothetical protein
MHWDSVGSSSDDNRPGLRSRTVKQLARDLMLARDNAASVGGEENRRLDVGEMTGRRGRAIFLLGAGCSVSAKIPLAANVSERCVCVLARRYNLTLADSQDDPKSALQALVKAEIVPERFVLPSGQGDWGSLYTYLFAEHLKSPNQQREIISRVIGDREFEINWAHACLGTLVQRRYVHTVLTTNFDQLALQGIIRTGITPVVSDGLESLTRISPSPARPQVVHLHGSMHTYDLRNSPAALTETGDDRNFQTMMMGLLKQATVLVVVGYAGGEEGVMNLLQYAAQTIPRMVVYWIAYEKSYRDLSTGARTLLETGENKFFIPDQDADGFFQALTRELGEGQPSWVADPILALAEQAERLRGNGDLEIADLIGEYQKRVSHAVGTRQHVDGALVAARQQRTKGNFKAAIELLLPIKDSDTTARMLYAQSLQDAFDENSDENADLIDRAIEEFEHLHRYARAQQRVRYAKSLIEALFDKVDTLADSDPKFVAGLDEILKVIVSARQGLGRNDQSAKALLLFYEARALQEKREFTDEADRGPPTREAIEKYQRALKNPKALGEKVAEARDGLAQAFGTYTDEMLAANPTPSDALRRRMRHDLGEAVQIHRDLVEHAWHNQPNSDLAGMLENLASDFEILAKLKRKGPFKETPLLEAVRAMEKVVAAYQAERDSDGIAEAQARLEDLRQKMR